MTRASLLHILDHVSAISESEIRELEQLAAAFPYCQTAHVLLAKAAHDQGSMLASQRLRRAATYATDRQLLRQLIEQPTFSMAAGAEPATLLPAPEKLPEQDLEPHTQRPEEDFLPTELTTAEPAAQAEAEFNQPVAEAEAELATSFAPAQALPAAPLPEPVPATVTPEESLTESAATVIAPAQAASKVEEPLSDPALAPEVLALTTAKANAAALAAELASQDAKSTAAPQAHAKPEATPDQEAVATATDETEAESTAIAPTALSSSAEPVARELSGGKDLLQAERSNNSSDQAGNSSTGSSQGLVEALKTDDSAAVSSPAATAPHEALPPPVAPPIRPPVEGGSSRFEFGLSQPSPGEQIVYELPTLAEEQVPTATVTAAFGFQGDELLGYALGGGSRLGYCLQPADEGTELLPGTDFFAPDALVLEQAARYLPAPPPAPSPFDLINKFLRNQPRLRTPAVLPATAQEQADLSVRSTQVVPDIASESLAKIMVRQGKIQKAIEIYERLIVRQPGKKAYFADQIQQLKFTE